MALIINGEEIDDEIVEQEFSQIKSHYEQMLQVSCCERDPEFRGYAKDNIAARVLLSQEAEKRIDEASDEEINQAKAALFEEHGGEDEFYMNMGLPMRDEALLVENIRQSLRVDSLLAEVSLPLPEPSEEEQKAFYEDNIDEFLTTEEVRASHITKNLRSASNREEVFKELRAVRKRLREGGEEFDEVAKTENDDEQQEVDLGFFRRGEFMEEFEAIAFSMDLGEVSPVFTTHLGLHLCKVTEQKAAEPVPFTEVKDDVLKLIHAEHREEKIEAFVEELKKAAAIEDTDPDDE